MKIFIFLFLINSFNLKAFTLNNNGHLAFNHDQVTVNVAKGFCTNIGISDDELLSIVKDATENFWNRSPTSRLKLVAGSLKTVSSNFQTGLICNSGTDCEPNSALAVDRDILISCNNNSSNFSSSGVLAVTVPNNISNSDIVGSLIIINDVSATNSFKSKSRDQKVAIIAHEIGHAFGLGHSPISSALMYYSLVKYREALGQDDIDGITYLYPKQQPISCGSISESSDSKGQHLFGLLIGFIFIYFLRKLLPRFSHSAS